MPTSRVEMFLALWLGGCDNFGTFWPSCVSSTWPYDAWWRIVPWFQVLLKKNEAAVSSSQILLLGGVYVCVHVHLQVHAGMFLDQ